MALGPSGVVAALADTEILLLRSTDSGFGWFSTKTAVAEAAVAEVAVVEEAVPVVETAVAEVAAVAAATALGGGGGMMNDDISSEVKTLARTSSGRPLQVCGGGGMVIVAKKDSRSRLIRFVLFLNPLSSTESIWIRGRENKTIAITL